MNADIENIVKQSLACLEYQQMKPQENALPYNIPCKPRDVISADICMVNNKILLRIVDYYNKFLTVHNMSSLEVGKLAHMAKMMFAEYGLPENSLRCRHKFHI